MRRVIFLGSVLLLSLLLLSLLITYLIAGRGDSFAFGDRVAVLEIHGTIGTGSSSGLFPEEGVTPQGFQALLDEAEADGSVKAILLDINSGGGSVVASEEIAAAIRESEKPTVAWLNEIAASGAYYIASAADYIVADRASLTGSIGVISIFPEYSRLLEKIGVNMTVFKGGRYKDFSSGFRPMTEEEEAMVRAITEEIYDQFLTEVAVNRNLSKDYVQEIAEGRIYTGTKAKELGLVDAVGGRKAALKKAAELGGIEGEPKTVSYRKTPLFEDWIGLAFRNLGYGLARGLVEVSTAPPDLRY
jgi:protease-4